MPPIPPKKASGSKVQKKPLSNTVDSISDNIWVVHKITPPLHFVPSKNSEPSRN